MPRIDNGTGRDISKWNGTLEKALIARKDMLNKCKTNNDLIDVLMDCEKDGLSAEGTAYTDRLIATISSNPNFRRNFQNVYNVLLKGTGNGVLKCSAKKPVKKGLKESVPDFSDCKHFYRFEDVVELAQTNPTAFGERSAFLSEVEGAEDLLNEPGYADAFVECPDSADIAPNTIPVWYLDDILDTVGATANFLLPDDSLGFFCDRCALLSFWDYLTTLYEEAGDELSLEDYGWDSVYADNFDPGMNRDIVNSKSVSVKSGVQKYTEYPDGGISTPDYPETIQVGSHTVDFEIVNDGIENIIVDGKLATWDLDNSDEETSIAYTDDNAVILFFGRHSLLDSVAVLNESLTAVLRNKITANYD